MPRKEPRAVTTRATLRLQFDGHSPSNSAFSQRLVPQIPAGHCGPVRRPARSSACEQTMDLTTGAGVPISLLGLGAREDRFAERVAVAAARGVNFFFIYHLSSGKWAAALRELAARDRARIAIATGSGSRTPEGLRRELAAYLRALGTDHLDVFFAEYVHPDEDPDCIHGDDGTLAELARWKDEGTIRYVGATAHDRGVSRRLAEDPRVDVLMQRYNMAHRKASEEVFPACRRNDVAVIVFTATRWGSLLAGHPQWPDEAPGAVLRRASGHRRCPRGAGERRRARGGRGAAERAPDAAGGYRALAALRRSRLRGRNGRFRNRLAVSHESGLCTRGWCAAPSPGAE